MSPYTLKIKFQTQLDDARALGSSGNQKIFVVTVYELCAKIEGCAIQYVERINNSFEPQAFA